MSINHIEYFQQTVCMNSFPPSASYMRQWTGKALVQIMACRPFGATELLPELVLTYGRLGTNFNRSSYLSFKEMQLNMSSGKWWPFCLSLNVLRLDERDCGRPLKYCYDGSLRFDCVRYLLKTCIDNSGRSLLCSNMQGSQVNGNKFFF